MHRGGNYESWGVNYAPRAVHQQPSPDYSNLYIPGAPPYAPPPPIVLITHTPPVAGPYDFPHSSFTPAQEPIADPNSESSFNPNSYYAPLVPSYNFDNGLLLHGSPGYGMPPASLGFEQAGSLAYMQGGTPAYVPGWLGSLGKGPAYDVQAFGAGSQGIGEVYAYDGGQQGQQQQGQGFNAYGSHMSSWNSGGLEGGVSLVIYNKGLGGSKVPRATPKVDTYDSGGGVQKYQVKLLPDSKDVICEVTEPSVFTFWAKSAVDVELRTIRLKSSSYTTSAILDTITAACVQLSEMLAKDTPSNTSSSTSAAVQRKSSIVDWVSIQPRALTQEEKQHWVPDEAATKCSNCSIDFSAFNRQHHCRNCGDLFCDRCSQGRTALTAEVDAEVVRVCDRCLAEVTQRLTNTKDTNNMAPVLRTHEDLAKTLQEELERNAGRKAERSSSQDSNLRSPAAKSSGTSVLNCSKCGSISLVTGSVSHCPSCGAGTNQGPPQPRLNSSTLQGSSTHMQEVACPTCTVHLQVQVPSFGTETVECGICQHPFLISAN